MSSIYADSTFDESSDSTFSGLWSSRWDRRFSVVSFLSVATALPAYSESETSSLVDTDEEPPVFGHFDDDLDDFDSPTSFSVLGKDINSVLHVVESGGVPVIYSIPTANSHYALLQPRFSRLEALNGCTYRPKHAVPYSFPLPVKRPWATLRLQGAMPPFDSRSGLPPRPDKPRKPEIWGGGPIVGTFEIDARNDPQTIQEITLRLRGKIVFLSGSEQGQHFTFFEHDVPLWNRTMESGSTRRGTGRRKFVGVHQFPFSIPFPVYVDLSNRSACCPSDLAPLTESAQNSQHNSFLQSSKYARPTHLLSDYSTVTILGKEHASLAPIPPSISHLAAPVKVHYELSVHIKHGWLRPDTSMKVGFNYIPSMLAIPTEWSSGHDGLFAIPPPWRSPSAWQPLTPFCIEGTFDHKPTRTRCQLFVAQPLSFVRGAHIPCFLSISGDNIEHFAAPDALNIHLVRTTDYLFSAAASNADHDNDDGHQSFGDVMEGDGSNFVLGSSFVVSHPISGYQDSDTGKNRVVRKMTQRVAPASWAPLVKDPMNPDEPDSVHLIGRINLSDELDPSCPCPIMALKYFVEFFTPKITGFLPDSLPGQLPSADSERKFASQFVEIATLEVGAMHRPPV